MYEIEKDVASMIKNSMRKGVLEDDLVFLCVNVTFNKQVENNNETRDCDEEISISDMVDNDKEISIRDIVYGKIYFVSYRVDAIQGGITTFYDFLLTLDKENNPLVLLLWDMDYENKYVPMKFYCGSSTDNGRKVVELLKGCDDYEVIFTYLSF